MLFRSLPPFDYIEAATVGEATEALAAAGGDAAVLAGGLQLLDDMKRGLKKPGTVVNLRRIAGLDQISGDTAGGLHIGATATIRAAEKSAAVAGYQVLSEALGMIHSIQVKNMGTVVGNVCTGTPASDILTALIACDGELRVADGNGGRPLGLGVLCEGAKKTCLLSDDLVTEIAVPAAAPGTVGAYVNLSRTKNDIMKLGVAVTVTMGGDGAVADARIAIGAVAPTIFRPAAAENLLKGSRLDAGTIAAAADAAYNDVGCCPIDDVRSTSAYRKEMVRVLVRRALTTAAARAGRA